jgi:putative ABC transport system permease protein
VNELFGIPINTLAIVLASLLGVAVVTVGVLGLANRTMFKFGLRNIPRRGLQSVLVVVGLALATLITTASFVTGDTIDHSLTQDTNQSFGRSDLDISWTGERQLFTDDGAAIVGQPIYANGDAVTALEREFAADPDIDAFLPFLASSSPVTNLRTGDAKPAIQVTGVDFTRLETVGGLTLVGGGTADFAALGGDGVFLSQRSAEDLHAKVGDSLAITTPNGTVNVRVVEIVEPLPGSDATDILPPCRSTIFLQIARPIPVPANSSRLWRRWNIPKMRSKYWASMPSPLSLTENFHFPSSPADASM